MSFLKAIGGAVRRKIHQRELEAAIRRYELHHDQNAHTKQSFADTGTFRSQLDRLFTVGNAAETAELTRTAEAVIASTLTNRYYRPADYLSDILDDLERHTYLTGELEGEAPIASLAERYQRELKLKAVLEAWLVPFKVVVIESSLVTHSRIVGRLLPYTALQNFERVIARLFAMADESELKLVQEYVASFLKRWRHSNPLKARFPEPAEAVRDALACLNGEKTPDGTSYIRTRRPDAGRRLSTVVPEDRQHYLHATLERWNLEP